MSIYHIMSYTVGHRGINQKENTDTKQGRLFGGISTINGIFFLN